MSSQSTNVAEVVSPAVRLVLRGGLDAHGRTSDIAIDQASGLITEVGEVDGQPDDVVEDCSGLVVVPSGVEVHAHLDKTLAGAGGMPTDLGEAVASWLDLASQLDHDSYVTRATAAIEAMVARGTTIIRTHVDVGAAMGLRGVTAMVAVREAMRRRGLCDVEVVALAAPPLGGTDGFESRRLLERAVDAGVDVVGGSPDIDPDPIAATRVAVEVAAASGLPIDLHTDQYVSESLFFLPEYLRLVEELGVTRVAASHCVSLASQSLDVQKRTAAHIADLGVSVFTMPLTSLFFFGWDAPVAPPRGVTAIRTLTEAGVCVAGGGDNVRDIFFPLGGFDPFETAAVLAMVAHLSPHEGWQMCSDAGRRALGREPVSLTPGSPAELVAIAATDLSAAVAARSDHRTVIHRGRVVSRTTTRHQLLG